METNNPLVPQVVKDIELTASIPQEMVLAQQQLIDWCDNKILSVSAESVELKESHEHAKANNWKSSVLKKHYDLSVKRLAYYEKIREALLAGYYIVPNFQIDLFAIRTNRADPKSSVLSYWNSHEQDAKELPLQEGEYKNPFPLVRKHSRELSDGKKDTWSTVDGWDDIEFPITMAKPMIMEATTKAMALKVFDEIGIVPHERKEDPIIIGRIFFKEGSKKKRVSFMIAWHLNTNVL